MQSVVNDVTVLFLGILLEALPFILLGSIIAAAISLFISDSLLYRFIPKKRLSGLIAASMMGLIFPVCDCTIIPVMRRLIRKGLPPSLGVTFMCAVPIVNPAVILSTYWAFTNQVQILWLRMLVGLCTAIAAGFIVGKLTREADPVRKGVKPDNSGCGCDKHNHVEANDHTHESITEEKSSCACGEEQIHAEHQHISYTQRIDDQEKNKASSPWRRFTAGTGNFLNHTTHEFIDSTALIIIGAFLSALIQIMIPRTVMYPIASSPFGSVSAMMAFTWVISLCANADAFVAKSFYGLFTTGSVIAFMTFGQMIDLKNTIVMLGFFRNRFVLVTISVIVFLCLTWGIIINLIGRAL